MATYLADTSALERLHHDDIAARLGPLFLAGEIAACALVDLELLYSARSGRDHAEIRRERGSLPHVPIDDAVLERAATVQGVLADDGRHRAVRLASLVIAAAAESAGLALLHYDDSFDLVAAVTGQRSEWVAPPGTVP